MSLLKIHMEDLFLKEFINNRPERPDYINSFEENPLWNVWEEYVQLFLKHGKYLEESGDLLFRIRKRMSDGYIEEIENYDKFDNIDFWKDVNPHSIFFLSNTEDCIRLEEDYGMLFISNQNKDDKANILFGFGQSKISITKDFEYKDYKFISKYKHPCNTLIINDTHILDEDKLINENLIDIIKYLLPSNLKSRYLTFQILILTGDNKKNINIETRYSQIKKEIERLNKSYLIELKICSKEAHHDRVLITNYLWIDAGHRFNIFKEKKIYLPEKSTTITIESFNGKKDMLKVVNDRKKDYIKIEKDTRDILNQKVVMPSELGGKITNRLLKTYH